MASSEKPITASREFYRKMFAHFRILVVKARGRVTLLQGKIKIKEKGTDEREEIEEEEKKKHKSIDKRYTPQNESLAPLAKILPLSAPVSREPGSEF